VGDAPGTVFELYAGAGNFTRHLVAKARRVWAHDGDAKARDFGRANVPGATWIDSLDGLAEPADLVLCDPPREGLDERAVAAVEVAGERIVYVSCDPQTLRRDARRLASAGWRLHSAVAMDLMPQTFHVEVVACFRRGA
jgi:23S rRNA (uracil1939-C5)-methyltransferase